MIAVVFSTTVRSPEMATEHDELVARMRAVAEATPGFVAWQGGQAAVDGSSSGAVLFETPEAEAAWQQHPEHLAIREQGIGDVYASFEVRVFGDLLRENRWDWQG